VFVVRILSWNHGAAELLHCNDVVSVLLCIAWSLTLIMTSSWHYLGVVANIAASAVLDRLEI